LIFWPMWISRTTMYSHIHEKLQIYRRDILAQALDRLIKMTSSILRIFDCQIIVGYVTPARPPTARSLVVGGSNCVFASKRVVSAYLPAYSTLNNSTNIRLIQIAE
jgi:hypothetical protein